MKIEIYENGIRILYFSIFPAFYLWDDIEEMRWKDGYLYIAIYEPGSIRRMNRFLIVIKDDSGEAREVIKSLANRKKAVGRMFVDDFH